MMQLPFRLEQIAQRAERQLEEASLSEQEREERLRVVRVGLSYNDTPYVHMGLSRKGGVDCATILGRVFFEAGLCKEPHILLDGQECALDHIHIKQYPRDFYRHTGAEIYLKFVRELCTKVEREPLPGDILTYSRELRRVAHAAIAIAWPEAVLHASSESGVGLDRGDKGLLGRDQLSGIWSIW